MVLREARPCLFTKKRGFKGEKKAMGGDAKPPGPNKGNQMGIGGERTVSFFIRHRGGEGREGRDISNSGVRKGRREVTRMEKAPRDVAKGNGS